MCAPKIFQTTTKSIKPRLQSTKTTFWRARHDISSSPYWRTTAHFFLFHGVPTEMMSGCPNYRGGGGGGGDNW